MDMRRGRQAGLGKAKRALPETTSCSSSFPQEGGPVHERATAQLGEGKCACSGAICGLEPKARNIT